jgi:UDP-hydrolysing UDP-N-acetyl-D-glucosamine 2-epimerase
MNIPLAHVQGGEITGSIDEKVRHAVTKLADLHFVATEKARTHVLNMGERPETVFLTGCPSIDLAMAVEGAPALDFDPAERYGGNGAELDLSDGYLVVMQHAVTTEYQDARDQITETLHTVHETGIPTVWFWPNEDAGSDGVAGGIRTYREHNNPENIRFFKNMVPEDFLKLLINSRALVGNSSVGIRECSYLSVPAINIGTRQSGRERGHNVVDVGYDRHEIKQAIERVMADGRPPADVLYGDGTAGRRIAELLAEVPLRIEKRLAY